MENIFLTQRNLFTDKGYSVVPVNGKRPFTDRWKTLDLSTDTEGTASGKIISFSNKNIGLKTGQPSGFICIDVDTEDRILQDKIYALLPPLYSGKIGNKNRGVNYFFKYNGEENETIPKILELISTERQIVVPPSIHPDEHYPYEWVGKSLLEIDKDDLPDLPDNFINDVKCLVGKMPDTSGNATQGRNHYLKSIVVAMRTRGEPESHIIDEIFSYDIENHSPPLFSDKKEGMRLEPKRNAWLFVNNITKSIIAKDDISVPHRIKFEIADYKEKDAPDYKKNKQIHFRGIAQDIFKHIYANSKVPRTQFTFASTLACMSTILGNKIQYQGTFPNLYLMILGKSGSGKDFPLKFPYKLFGKAGAKRLIGEGSPSSHTSLIHNLATNSVRLDAIDEASFLFRGMNAKESFTSKMAEVYQTLYTSTGDYFAGVTATVHKSDKNLNGRLGECNNPYVNLFCGMTINDFSETFTTRLMEKGLGGRFMYFIDTETKLIEWRDPTPLPRHILEYVASLQPEIVKAPSVWSFSDEIMSITITPKTKKYLDEIRIDLDKKSKMPGVNEKIMPILNRKAQLLTKLALIDSCSTQWEKPLPEINLGKDNIDWALKTIDSNSDNMELFINDYLAGGKQERMINLIQSVLAENGGKMSSTELGRNYRVKSCMALSDERKIYLRSMESDGIISSIKDGDKNNKTYWVLN